MPYQTSLRYIWRLRCRRLNFYVWCHQTFGLDWWWLYYSLKRLCTIDSWNNQDLTTIYQWRMCRLFRYVPQTMDRWNYCIMADWILVGVIMGWHSIKRTVEGVVLVKLLSSLPLYLCQTLDCSFCNVPWFLGWAPPPCELDYGGRSRWNWYYYKRQSSRNISSNSSCTKSCR